MVQSFEILHGIHVVVPTNKSNINALNSAPSSAFHRIAILIYLPITNQAIIHLGSFLAMQKT